MLNNLRKTVKRVYNIQHALRVEMHPVKTFFGKVKKCFDFLGFQSCPTSLKVSQSSLSRQDKELQRLNEQGASSKRRIAKYLAMWLGWAIFTASTLSTATTTTDIYTSTATALAYDPLGMSMNVSYAFIAYTTNPPDWDTIQSAIFYWNGNSDDGICRSYTGGTKDHGADTQPDESSSTFNSFSYSDSLDSGSPNENINFLATTPTTCLRRDSDYLVTDTYLISVFPPVLTFDSANSIYSLLSPQLIPPSPLEVECSTSDTYNSCREQALSEYHALYTADTVPTATVTTVLTTETPNSITLNWTDAYGDPEPHGYQISCSTTNYSTVAVPSDGDWEADDTDCSDGAGSQRIRQGAQTLTWNGLADNTKYYFKIFPFTNQMSFTKYNTTSPAQINTTLGTVTWTLTVGSDGTGSGTTGGGGLYADNTSVTPTQTAGTGSTFTGWTPGICASAFNLTADTTCTATFTLDTHTLTVGSDGTGSGTTGGGGTYAYNSSVTPTQTASTGSTFTGWTPSSCGSAFNLTADTTCTATFTLQTHTLTVGSDGTGSGTTGGGGTYAYDTSVTPTYSAGTGSTFTGWTPGSCGSAFNLTADTTCTATFTLQTHTLTVGSDGTGSGTTGGGGTYAYNTSVTPTQTAGTGSTFTGWTPVSCGSAFNLTADTTCTATFTLDTHTLTVGSDGTGSGTTGGGGTYAYNTSVTPTQTAGTGSTFTGWTPVSCASAFNLTADTTCTATFADTTPPTVPTVNGTTPTNVNTPTWTWSSGGGGNGNYRYKLNDTDLTSGTTSTSSLTYTPASTLTDGTHTLYVQERDAVGNWSSSGSKAIEIDTASPTAPTVNGTTPTNVNTPTWTWSSGGGGNGNYRYKLDDNDLTSGTTSTSSLTYTPASTLTDGTHTLYVQERDAVGNWSSSGSKALEIDTADPTVTVEQAGSDPTSTGPIYFTATFNETVNGFATGDVTIGGTASATTDTVTGSGPYNIAISGMTGHGTVTASIATNKAVDDAGNDNAASTSTDNSVQYYITSDLVINEVDYDQVGTDTAEFIELYNKGGSGLDLSLYEIQLIDGDGTTVNKTINTMSGTLAANDYYVICGDNTKTANCDLDVTPNSDMIQDDIEAIVLVVKASNAVVDALTYEGALTTNNDIYSEGIGASADSSIEVNVSLSRYADGVDTNANNTDISLRCITPGLANNVAANSNCYQLSINDPTAINEGDSTTSTLQFTASLSSAAPFAITVDYATADNTATTTNSDYDSKSDTLTFGIGETSKPIDVTINGDQVDEGTNETFYVNLSNVSASANIANAQGTGTITDDDTKGFTITPTSGLTTTESAGTTTFTVVLNSQPTADVTIGLTSDNTNEGTVSPASLTFKPTGTSLWNVAQTVTITGVDDSPPAGDGNVGYNIVTAAATGGDYAGINPNNVSVTNNDNDTPGFAVSPSNLIISEPAGNDTFTIKLNTQPTGGSSVTVPLSTSPNCTISSTSVTITNGNWNTDESVTVTAVNDDIDNATNRICTITTGDPTSSGGTPNDATYNGFGAGDVIDIGVTVQDDDTASSTVNPTTLAAISEPTDSTTFNVKLATAPASDVTVGLSTPSGECSAVASGTLTSTNYAGGVTVTVTATNDNINDGDQTCTVVTSFTGDAVYAAIDPDDVTVTVGDDDTAGITISGTPTSVEGGTTGTYTITLDTTPTAGNVTIGITPDAQCTVSSSSVIISNTTPSTITVTAVNDGNVEGNHTCTINHAITAGPSEYPTSMSVASVTANVTDNDYGVIITQTSGSTKITEGGATGSYTVELSTEPANDVTVTITPDAQTTVDKSTLTFTNGDWNTAQTVTVTAIDDAAVESTHSSTISHSAGSVDTNYNQGDGVVRYMVDSTETANVTASITDNDNPPSTDGGPSTPLPTEMTVFTKFGGYGSGTVTSSPSGINCKTADEECSAKFDTASHVELTAKADSGSIFDRWSGKDCDTEIFLVSSRTCTAYFKLTPRTLTIDYPENGVITSSPSGIDCGNTSQKCSSEFEGGKNISLTATPNTDYMLDSWSQNCPDGKVQLLENTECAATFKVKPAEPIVITPVDPTVPDVVPPTTGTDSVVPTTPDADEPAISTNTVSFSEQNYEVAENAGQIEITATRIGTEGKVTVELHSSEDNRHEQLVKTLVWKDQQDGDITVPITIIDNDKVDGNKEVILSLGATENASLIDPDTSVLTIVDDDKLDVKTPIEEISSTTTSTSVPANNACSGGHVINTTCNYGWKDAKDILVEEKGNIGYANIVSDIKNNQGRISNSNISKDVQVTGGIFSGYISNLGTLADFEFLGGSINGANDDGEVVGTLAGQIINTSEVEGFFENVRLASGTHIIGGILNEHIIGNSKQPALLENLLIKSDAVISNVILAEDVIWEKGVVFGENIGFSVHVNYMKTHSIIELPALGDAIFFKSNARSFARLTGGASENGGPFQRKSTITRKSQVTIKSNLLIDVKHIGKQADILVVAIHEGKFYMLNSEGKPVIWNGNISNLVAFQKQENLAPVEAIEIWNNPLDTTGSVKVYVGYRLANGKIVYSPKDMIEMDFVE
ncbi:Calx-beta domain-containing protein [Candidatus Halobeggiatoa sp. HSG11]|nr:Calx-beta domain-containing protein [Candidatus Halobeggiatoa sp. HSG11]